MLPFQRRRLYSRTVSVLADVSCATFHAVMRITVGRQGGCCATFDGGGSAVSVLADAGSAACCFISAACAGFYAVACVTVWHEGDCCATFNGGGSTVSVLTDVSCAAWLLRCGARHRVARR